MQTITLYLSFGLCLAASALHAMQDPATLCDRAAERAAASTGVPLDVLRAIARVEAGRTLNGVLTPWPWTVNEAGSGAFFDSAQAVTDHVATALANGASNIDIGCFQVNLHWHGGAFASVADMVDPEQNAVYAARFLLDLYQEFGTWDEAVGAYHSRRSDHAEAYLAKVRAQTTLPLAPETPGLIEDMRGNRYPLLQSGSTVGFGSLFAARSDHQTAPLLR